MQSFSKSEAIRFGWESFKKYPWLLLGVTVTVIVLPAIIRYAVEFPFPINDDTLHPATVVAMLLSGLLSIFFGIGVLKFAVKIAAGKSVTYQDIFSVTAEEFFRYTVGSILYGLIVFAGFLLLILPGIYFGLKYQFYSYLILDKNLSPMNAIKESGRMTEGQKWNLFLFDFLLGLLSLLGFITLFVGIFVAYPVTWVAQAFVYRKLLARLK